MIQKLTDDQISSLCMYMRVIDFFRKNRNVLNEEMEQHYYILCKNVNEIMEALTDEQRDEILEIHKIQLQEIAKQSGEK